MNFLARSPSHFRTTSQRSIEGALDISWNNLFLLTLVLFVISLASIEFTRSANSIATLWPSNAILLAAMLRSTRHLRNYGLICLGGGAAIALANLVGGNGPALSVALTMGNLVEVAAAWVLLALFQDNASDLTCIRGISIFMLLAGGIAPLASASIGTAAVAATHSIPWVPIWLNWYAADALGMIIVAPFLLSLKPEAWHALRIKKRSREALGVLALIVLVTVVASYYRSYIFISVPVVLFATFRFGVIGAATGTLVIALIAGVFIIKGMGPSILSESDLSPQRILALQIFLAATSFWSLPVAAVLAERDRLLADLALTNSRLEVEGARKSQLVVGLHRRLVNAEESERLRLSHELHDQTGQSLAAAMLELRYIEPLVVEEGRERLHLLRKRMAEIGKALHRVAWELRPASIDELGLASALSNDITEWGAQYGIEVDFYCGDPRLDKLSEEIRTTIFRLAQEGLTNIVKHARGATSVSVVIEQLDTMLQLVIEDDGCGFNTGAAIKHADDSKGLGLVGMRERLLLLGGKLEIESSTGAGATIFARIPVKSERTTA